MENISSSWPSLWSLYQAINTRQNNQSIIFSAQTREGWEVRWRPTNCFLRISAVKENVFCFLSMKVLSCPGRPKIILNALSCFSMLAKNGGIFSPISTLFLRTNNYDLFHIKPFINVGDGAFSSEGSSLKRLLIKQERK